MSSVDSENFISLTLKNSVLLILDDIDSVQGSLTLLCQQLRAQNIDVNVASSSLKACILDHLTEYGWPIFQKASALTPSDIYECCYYFRCIGILVFTNNARYSYWDNIKSALKKPLKIILCSDALPDMLCSFDDAMALAMPNSIKTQNLTRLLDREQRQCKLHSLEQAILPLGIEPVWHTIKVTPGEVLSVQAALNYVNTGTEKVKKALLLFRAEIADGRLLSRLPELSFSDLSNASYCYLPCTENKLEQILRWVVPADILTLHVGVQSFFLGPRQQVTLSQLIVDTNPRDLIVNEIEQQTRDLFYNKGAVTAALAKLATLKNLGITLSDKLNVLEKHIQGVRRLRSLPVLPPKQACPLYLPKLGQVLYCLHQALPYFSNGYATRSQGIAKGLQQAGFNVRAVVRPGLLPKSDLSDSEVVRYHQLDGIDYYFYAGSVLDEVALDHYLQEAADVFVREAISCQASVIIAASNHLTAIPALIAARRLGLPFVYEVRGLWELTKAAVRPLWQHTERFKIDAELERFVMQQADMVLTLTEQLSKELQRRGVKKEHIHLAPNAVNTALFTPRSPSAELQQQLDLNPDIPVIGYAGSAVAYEGLSLLMQALSELHQRQQPFQFLLVGDGSVLEQVQLEAQQLGILSACRFPGRVPFEQMPDYIACMDILPIPRIGTVVTELVSALKPLEAMAMSKAVVLSDVEPHHIFAGDQERALLFEKDNAIALANVLQQLLCQPELRLKLGKAARQWIEVERSWQKITADYANAIKLLPTLLEAKQAKPLSSCRLALIADTFSTQTLQHVVNCELLMPDTWQQQLIEHPVDALLIESAWEGNQKSWSRAIGYYSDDEFANTRALINYCKKYKIPVLFWNKEDPIHFERFSKIAAMADHVFTSDASCIIRYMTLPEQQNVSVSSASFFADPQLHNPLPSNKLWQHTIAYAGTYYGDRYAERSNTLDIMLSTAAPAGLTIYDRQANIATSPYVFPRALQIFSQGALDYTSTVEAYKSHPLQLNVNSVTNSATMCSRRVMEIAACGTAIISGPGVAVKQLFGDTVRQVANDQQMLDAAELLENDVSRWKMALAAHRKVMRCHTASQRLSLMLRSAGLQVIPKLPERPVLVVYDMSYEAVQVLLKQSLLPKAVLAVNWQVGAREQLLTFGIVCDEVPEGSQQWLWAMSSAQLCEMDVHDIEDLMHCRLYYNDGNVVFNRDNIYQGGNRGLAGFDLRADLSLVLIMANFDGQSASDIYEILRQRRYAGNSLQLRKPNQILPFHASNGPIILIASHDIKFMRMFWPYMRQAGYRLLLDFWHDHKTHNENRSLVLLEQAQMIFCEWLLGNALWYGKHKLPSQRLFGRLHLQELQSPVFAQLTFSAFEAVYTVAEHLRQQAVAQRPECQSKISVLHNAVDISRFKPALKQKRFTKVLGIAGIVPQRKRFDLALDILAELRKNDPEYVLRVKGKLPSDYSWMRAHRAEEMAWFDAQFLRIQQDPLLQGAVQFDQHDDDMPGWYQQLDAILSPSDFESFHYSVAEGAACGCQPVIFNWQGANTLYPEAWCVANVVEACAMIENLAAGQGLATASLSDWIVKHYALETISATLIEKLQAVDINSKMGN